MLEEKGAYAEGHFTAWARVADEEPFEANSRQFIDPYKVTANFEWCTQLGHESWHCRFVEVAGTRLPRVEGEEFPGSVVVLFPLDTAPAWARRFAEDNQPTHNLVPVTAQCQCCVDNECECLLPACERCGERVNDIEKLLCPACEDYNDGRVVL